MHNFPNNYNHKQIEENWRRFWEENKTYAWDSSQDRENNFVIDTPPPTVSGTLHMGHVFSYTQTDFIARYQRMKGKNVFYPMGFDNNGLPTERLVEKVKQIRANSMERSEFIKTCQEVVAGALDDFRSLFKSLALSVDWAQEYQTISPLSRKISQLSFLDLLNKNDCYRKLEPCLWDIIDQTALAQADIVDLELKSFMSEIIFYSESNEKLHIATTRPELLAACVAIFYHPDDQRYTHLKNSFAYTPLFNVKVPLIADEKVDIEKGTGLVMCCTFGDTTDVEWWKEHNLPTRIIFDKRGRLTHILDIINSDLVAKNFSEAKKYAEELANLKINEARLRTLEILKNEDLLVKQEEVTRAVKCAERSGAPLEILITHQWFVKTLDKKEGLIKRSSECNWYPTYMKTRLENWINGLNWDWCISRQRYFGVPFPVWYSKRKGEEGKIIVADIAQLPVDPLNDLPIGYSKDEVELDYDVMDTWATSSISPQLNSHAISDKYVVDIERHKKLFPADLRPQAHEIIRTWTFYTMLKAHIHEQTIPWKNLMISGWCLAADKTKMSKSKGNVVTPINLIEEKGVDIVRYWASNSRLGADIAYSEEMFALGKKLVNKIWNAAKFANIHLSKLTNIPTNIDQDIDQGIIFEPIDLWILEKLQFVIKNATQELEQFEYCIARGHIEEFFWKDYCDNYIEIVKTRAYDELGNNPKGQMSAIYTIYHCLNNLLKLFAPYLPHITEEIYQVIFAKNNESIHAVNMWPAQITNEFNKDKLQSANIAIIILDAVRKIKADKQISIKTPIETLKISDNTKNFVIAVATDLSSVINALAIEYTSDFDSDFIDLNDNIKIKANFNL